MALSLMHASVPEPQVNTAAPTANSNMLGEDPRLTAFPRTHVLEPSMGFIETMSTLLAAQERSGLTMDTAINISSPESSLSPVPQDEEVPPTPSVPVVKRGRGRPPKPKSSSSPNSEPAEPKRGVGRPRKDGTAPRNRKAEAAAAAAQADALSLLPGIKNAGTPGRKELAADGMNTRGVHATADAPQAENEATSDDTCDLNTHPYIDLDDDVDTATLDVGEDEYLVFDDPGDGRVVVVVEAYLKRNRLWNKVPNNGIALTQLVKVYEIACQIGEDILKDAVIEAIRDWTEKFRHDADRPWFCNQVLHGLQRALTSRHIVPYIYASPDYLELNPFRLNKPPFEKLQRLLTDVAKEHMNELRHDQVLSSIYDTGQYGRELRKISEQKSRALKTRLIQCPDCRDIYPQGSLSRCRACNKGPGAWLSTKIGSYVDSRESDEISKDIGNIRYVVRCPESYCNILMPGETFYLKGAQPIDNQPSLWKGACVACGTYRQEWASCLVPGKFVDVRNDAAFARAERDRVLRMAQGAAPMTTTCRPYRERSSSGRVAR